MAVGELYYTSVWVERNSHWALNGSVERRSTPVPLCRCMKCRSRFRVLPIEIAPFKHYTRKVIENGCAAYSDADLPGITLRRTVMRMGPGHPHHSSLHGWLGGLGERALGLLLNSSGGEVPVSALIAETARRRCREMSDIWTRRYPVAERKYRSQRRAEYLESCARVFAVATHIFPAVSHPFLEWEKWLQEQIHVTAWEFPARAICTGFQQPLPRGRGVESTPNTKAAKGDRYYAARSPP